jgi:hypothetical protein
MPFHVQHGPVLGGGDDLGALRRGEDGVFALRAGDGGVPGEGLIFEDDAVGVGGAEVVAALVAAGAALVVEVPFLGVTLRGVFSDAASEHFAHGGADAGVHVERDIDGANGGVPVAQGGRRFAEIDEAREGDDQAVLPGAQDDHDMALELALRRQGMAVAVDPFIGGDEQDHGGEVALPAGIGGEAGDAELGLAGFDDAADLVEGGLGIAAQGAVALHLGGLERVMEWGKQAGLRLGAEIPGVRQDLLGVGDLFQELFGAGVVVPFKEQRFGAQALDDLILLSAHLDAVGEDVEFLGGDQELAEGTVAIEGDMGLAAASQPGEVGLEAEEGGIGPFGLEERADLGEFLGEFRIHEMGLQLNLGWPILGSVNFRVRFRQ